MDRYNKGGGKIHLSADDKDGAHNGTNAVGRCRFTVSKPMLKSHMVSELEATM